MWHISSGAGGGTASTVGTTLSKAAHGLTAGNAVTITGVKAKADSSTTLARGLVVAVPSAATYTIVTDGYATLTAHGLGTAGQSLFLSQATAGLLTATQPGSGIIQEVGQVYDANTIYVAPIVAATI